MDLPICNGHNATFTYVDRLTKYCRLITCFMGEGALNASPIAKIFFDNIVRFFGVPAKAISNRDPRFTTSFW